MAREEDEIVLLNGDKGFVLEKTSYDHPHKLFNTILYIANRKDGCLICGFFSFMLQKLILNLHRNQNSIFRPSLKNSLLGRVPARLLLLILRLPIL